MVWDLRLSGTHKGPTAGPQSCPMIGIGRMGRGVGGECLGPKAPYKLSLLETSVCDSMFKLALNQS